MPVSATLRNFPNCFHTLKRFGKKPLVAFTSILLLLSAAIAQAASIRGVVTDTTGAKIPGASVVLLSNGKIAATTVTTADGSFQILTGATGRFYLLVSSTSFRQLETPSFYAGPLDSVERNLVLEPAWVRASIVVTATGTPTPQPQTSETTSVIGPLDLERRTDLVNALRLMPGTSVVQSGQLGSATSLFVRGGDSNANKIVLDGLDAGDLGNGFDFGPLSTTAIERAEVYRGPDSNLYGAGAGSSVVSMRTERGTTNYPSIIFDGDAGNFYTSHEALEAAGAHKKLDYLGEFSWLETSNALPNDEYHVATTSANVGWQLTGNTQIRATFHYGVSGEGDPNSWDFYHIADNATQKDQDLFVSASIDNQTTASLHNTLRYGATRKREQYNQWSQEGIQDIYGDSFGDYLTISGANGYSASGQALLDYAGIYPYNNQIVNNRDQLNYQGDYKVTQHLAALIGFHYEDERGVENSPTYGSYSAKDRTNYFYLASVHGDYKNRFYYTLGGSLERYSIFGTQTSPHAGLSYYALRPHTGHFSGTRIFFNYGDGVREATLTNEIDSLYAFLENGHQADAEKAHIGPLAAPTTRSYEGGLEQSFFSERLVFRSSYFHNEFGKEIESVPGPTLLTLFPDLTKADLGYYYTYNYGLDVNTGAFRAQGIETTVESGLGKNIFLRGGYTYLDAVVQRSFDSDNEPGYGLSYNNNGTLIPLGAYTPLVGARPFRRPPHTGFFTATYAQQKLSAVLSSSFASRSDDTTFLEGMDINYENSLLLPNRNLDWGYAKIDLGASYKLLPWLGFYIQKENLMSNQHIAPIGYPSLPFTFRAGLRLEWTKTTR